MCWYYQETVFSGEWLTWLVLFIAYLFAVFFLSFFHLFSVAFALFSKNNIFFLSNQNKLYLLLLLIIKNINYLTLRICVNHQILLWVYKIVSFTLQQRYFLLLSYMAIFKKCKQNKITQKSQKFKKYSSKYMYTNRRQFLHFFCRT